MYEMVQPMFTGATSDLIFRFTGKERDAETGRDLFPTFLSAKDIYDIVRSKRSESMQSANRKDTYAIEPIAKY